MRAKNFDGFGRRYLVASVMLLVAGCGIGPIYLPHEAHENIDRVIGYPGPAPQPLAPVAGNAWPAAPTAAPTMWDFLKQEKTAGTLSPRPAGGAAGRGDYGLCRPGAQGAALGVC